MSAEPNLRSMRAIEADQTLASIMRGIAATLVLLFFFITLKPRVESYKRV